MTALFTRRHFLRKMAFTAGAAAGTRVFGGPAVLTGRSPNSKLGVGVIACGGTGGGSPDVAASERALALADAVFGETIDYTHYDGDTWINTWADDDELYSISDDCNFPGGESSNLAVNKFSGCDPRHLVRTVVNKMKEYGKCVQLFGPERYCWKGNSILCVDGVLYASLSRHDYPWRTTLARRT